MKTRIKQILTTSFFICLLTFSARATLVMSENFNYANGILTNSTTQWRTFSIAGTGNLPVQDNYGIITFTNVLAGSSGDDILENVPGQPYTSGVYYMSAMVAISNATTSATGDYFLALYSTNSSGGGYMSRIFQCKFPSGGWTFGFTNAGGTTPITWTSALVSNTWYKIILRYDVSARTATFGVFNNNYVPTSDSELTLSSPASSTTGAFSSIAIRQGGNSSPFYGAMDYVLVGSSLADVAGTNYVPPAVVTQPQDAIAYAGTAITFTNFTLGDPTLVYQWYYNTNTLLVNSATNAGVDTSILTLSSLITNQTGTYSCVITNLSGTNVTRYAQLTVFPLPIPPTIDTNTTPSGTTNGTGDNVTFSVGAHGLPAVAYQWYFIPDTNSAVTNIMIGATGSSFTVLNVTTNQAGKYFVTITNSTAYYSTNSNLGILKVNPVQTLNISDLRAKVDNTYAPTNTTTIYTAQGIVTTWTNMTTSTTSLEFYMQDASGGMAVFWSGAVPTNLPPAGALVSVSGPLAAFGGLLEMEPVYTNTLNSVTVISTGNPLPTPQPLPFDPNITGNMAVMKTMESSYFVASNVTLKSEATFVSASAGEFITNNAYHIKTFTNSIEIVTYTNDVGQSVELYINAGTDIPGKSKPTGPVTIYGVLGYYVFAGFQLTPSRFADIVSYIHVTNVLSNVSRKGDMLTNNFNESVLRPGDTLTTYVSIGDPEGGNVTLVPITAGLPSDANWSDVMSGQTGSAIFHFTPTTGDASSNYFGAVSVASTSGNNFTNKFNVYVPTPVEQKIYITEIFANSTANTNSPAYNPLKRPNDALETSLAVDRYVEIANLSGTDQSLGNWDFGTGSSLLHTFDQFNSLETVASSNAFVVYGGPANSDPSTPTILGGYPNSYIEPISAGESLTLSTNGGTIALHNNKGYLVDRVTYPASALNTSFSRFPTVNDGMVPQSYISTNFTTAGSQYDGGAWSSPTKVPAGVTNVAISIVNKQAVIGFTADTNLASTLWQANEVSDSFTVVNGKQFTNSAATFSVTNLPSTHQFYFISTQ